MTDGKESARTRTCDSRFRSRRELLQSLALLAAFPAGANVPAVAQAEKQPEGPSGSTLLLLGTQGGPSVNPDRGETASAVLAGGRPYLVDCGYGTLRALAQAGLSYNDIATIFLTHLHDDHTSDVAALLSHKWTSGREHHATVHGPFGAAALVQGAIAFFKGNTDIRVTDEGRAWRPEQLFQGRDVSAPEITEVFRDERVKVKAVENTHFPERAKQKMAYRSLAYRFDMPDRSIVFSGDTAYSKNLVDLARNADLFVCEAIDTTLHQQLERAAKAAGGADAESIARHVIETHSTTVDAGRMAAEAKVKKVVLNHLLPGSNVQRGNVLADEAYIAGVRKHFSGEVVVGRDQMRL
jgi:ribonuclease BN (tRNA processing enzyme)